MAGYSADEPDIRPALQRFATSILEQDFRPVGMPRLTRGFRHLFPDPAIGGACKRWHLFLRWMVRRTPPDFGDWREVSPSKLLIPLDTHIANMAHAIRLTRLRTRTGRMAADITGTLRRLDPADPVKYDFALCHTRMRGDCLDRRDARVCPACQLRHGLPPLEAGERTRSSCAARRPRRRWSRSAAVVWGVVVLAGAIDGSRPAPSASRPRSSSSSARSRPSGARASAARTSRRAAVHEEVARFSGQVGERLGQLQTAVAMELQQVTAEVNRRLQDGMALMQDAQKTMGQRLEEASRAVTEVHGQLGALGEATRRMEQVGRDIAGLEQILRAPKMRGGFGEMLLERLLAEILPADAYRLQHGFRSGDKVDAAVVVAGRLVPVDSKFPLENFRRMLEEPDEERRRQARRAFLKDVRSRVDEIAKKYIVPDEGTFDFALMYIPAENVYYEVILRDEARRGLARSATRCRAAWCPCRPTPSTRTSR